MKRFLIFIIPFFLISCITIKYQKVFDEIFEDAGKNSSEIKKAIHYFQNSGNYLQLNSLYYLLENTNGHSYVEYGAISANNDTLQYELENFSTYLEAKAAWDSLESEYGKLNWQPTKEIRDIKIISSKYLIENVELAYEVWKNKPWSKKYSFNVFLEYILPYRVDDEPTAKWRRFFLQQFQGLEKEMQNPYDSIEAANLINNKLKSWWDYDEKYSLDPNARSFMELLRTGEGSINDINIMILYALRANGIPSTLDFHISNLSFHNNTWIAVIDQEGNTIPIYNWQTDSKKLMEEKISPKVYRKSYRKQINNLTNIEKDEKLIPPELSGLHFFDVTPFYTKVNDITIEPDIINYPPPENCKYLFLAIYNKENWQTIDWAFFKKNSAEFIDLGLPMLYLPCYYENKIIPAGKPFILQKNGKLRTLETKENYEEIISNLQKTQSTSK